jgi:beta-galactosidase
MLMYRIRLFRAICFSTFLGTLCLSCNEAIPGMPRERISFNQDWYFIKDDPQGAETANFDHSEWRAIDLPHDWGIEGPFTTEVNYKGGYLPYPGTGWYWKSFDVPADAQRVCIEFDGVMRNSKVWVNGEYVGGWPYGYTSFVLDLTDKLVRGGENQIAVRVENQDYSSRWYPGSGIYRNVWLSYTQPVHIAQWGTYVTTPYITNERANVEIQTRVLNTLDIEVPVELETAIRDTQGQMVAKQRSSIAIAPGSEYNAIQQLEVKNPQLWDLETPNLYTAESRVLSEGKIVDTYETPFGIRSFRFDADEGFFLNGRHVKLKGVNLHHGLGPLGAAVSRRATERQLEIMQEMGVNAIRSAHNPPSPEQLDLCDQMGILVIDETFDTWSEAKGDVPNDYSIWFEEWAARDTEALVRRDRNHPSVILWSIGNEVMNLGTDRGKEDARMQAGICRKLDPTRPVIAGVHLTVDFDEELAAIFDVFGMNYWQDRYAEVRDRFPDLPLLSTESSATLSSRGYYEFPVKEIYQAWRHLNEAKQISSYDMVNTGFGALPEVELAWQDKPWMAGTFVWSGFDYHGEPDPYEGEMFPAHSSYFGIVDMCGFKKDRFYLYQSQWTVEPMIHLLPHWNWEGREGQITPVFVYSNCAKVELFVNGRSHGTRTWEEGRYRFKWNDVVYQPGSIRAVGYGSNGVILCEKEIKTSGKASQIVMEADRNILAADGKDLSFITVKIMDSEGNLCPLADHLVEFDVDGAGILECVGNGDPTCIESYQGSERSAFHGMCLLVVKTTEQAGEIRVIARAEGLGETGLTLQSERN